MVNNTHFDYGHKPQRKKGVRRKWFIISNIL